MIIGFGHRAFSGKDTAAGHMVSSYGFTRRAFADPLKQAAKVIFHLTDEQLYGSLKDVVDSYWKETPRTILQKLGDECMRQGYHQDVWVMSMRKFIIANPDVKNWVISDVRYPNEVKAIQDWGGMVVKVERDVPPANGVTNHTSEHILDNFTGWDLVLDNNSTFGALYAQLDRLAEKYCLEKSDFNDEEVTKP